MMHISITGDLGSGKSTVAKELCKNLGYTYMSTGKIQRNLALELGMNTLEFNKYTDENLHIDDYIDNKLKEINQVSQPHVLDSRLAWHFVRPTFKIYLMVLDEVAAERVLKDNSRIGEAQAMDIQSKIKELRQRRESENQRFEKNYGVKPRLFQDFDAIVDTSTATIEEVTTLLIDLYKKYAEKVQTKNIWLSPIRILPTRNEKIVKIQDNEDDSINKRSPVDCILYKREFYLYSGSKALISCLKTLCPFLPVHLKAKEGDGLLDAEGFVKSHFFIEDMKAIEKEYSFIYRRQPII